MTATTLVDAKWDYTKQAPYYKYRPNYPTAAVAMLATYANNLLETQKTALDVADLGAGTGNLSVLLEELGHNVTAVEPNDAMREEGMKRSADSAIVWKKGTGTASGLDSHSYDWVTYGSSFNVIDRTEGLKEAHRLLRSQGAFSCMWNHRDLDDPIQNKAEAVILNYIPEYTRGVRREDQRSFIEQADDLFDEINYLEQDFYFHQSCQDYIDAWRSVRNKFWDFNTPEGAALFDQLASEWKATLPETFSIRYTMRAWSAKKRA